MSQPRRRWHPWLERLDAAAVYWLGEVVPAPDQALRDERWRRDRRSVYCPRCGVSVGPSELVQLVEDPEAASVAIPTAGWTCATCRSTRPPWTTVVRLGPYAPPLSDWILAVKVGPRWGDMAERLGQELGAAVRQVALDRRSDSAEGARPLVVPVPMPTLRRWHRGIDHGQAIAAGVAGRLGLSVRQVLARPDQPAQATQAASARLRQGGGGLRPRRGTRRSDVLVRGRRVLLVDDVLTTGATARACTRALKRLGAEEIVLAVVAVTDPPGRDSTRGAHRSPVLGHS